MSRIKEKHIDDQAVSLIKMKDMATSSLIYRTTAGTGTPEINSLATLKTDLGLVGGNTGDQDLSHTGEVTGTTQALTLDKTAISNQADTVILAGDTILFGDATATNALKKDTVQGILDLVPAVDLSGYLLNTTDTFTGILTVTGSANVTATVSAEQLTSTDQGDIANELAVGTTSGKVVMGDITGNARGSGALDIQSSRSAVTQVASGAQATAIGYNNTASGFDSFTVGSNNTASEGSSFALGSYNTASGSSSSASGYNNTASGVGSTAFGSGSFSGANTASGNYSSAFGFSNTALGTYSTAAGAYNTTSATKTTAIGNNISNSTANSVEIGPSNTAKIRVSSAGLDALTLPIVPATIADGSAPNNSIYYSSTASKLVYKNSGGTVNNLY